MTTRRHVVLLGLSAVTARWALAGALVCRDRPPRLRTFVRAHFASIAPGNEDTWQSTPRAKAEAVRMLEAIAGDDEAIRSELARRTCDDLERGRIVTFSGVCMTVTEAAIQVIVHT